MFQANSKHTKFYRVLLRFYVSVSHKEIALLSIQY